jgi:hypothetical protein
MKHTACFIFVGLFLLYLIMACGNGASLVDSDGDGLSDSDEVYIYGTDPLKADTDGDGRSDGEEVMAGTNPLVADFARTVTLNNNSSKNVTIYIVFATGLTGNGGTYTADDFNKQGCNMYRPDRCSFIINKGKFKTLNLSKGGIDLSVGLDHEPMGPCPTTMFEINISPNDNKTHDHYDVSLVNGFNYSIQLIPSAGTATTKVTKATGNQDAVGVFPLGCTECISKGSVPPTWDDCPGNPSSCGAHSQCYSADECKTGPDRNHPNAACDLEATTGGNYTVNIGDPS